MTGKQLIDASTSCGWFRIVQSRIEDFFELRTPSSDRGLNFHSSTIHLAGGRNQDSVNVIFACWIRQLLHDTLAHAIETKNTSDSISARERAVERIPQLEGILAKQMTFFGDDEISTQLLSSIHQTT